MRGLWCVWMGTRGKPTAILVSRLPCRVDIRDETEQVAERVWCFPAGHRLRGKEVLVEGTGPEAVALGAPYLEARP